jgi:tetratricopeptide (TPR) repeat protein
MTLTSDDYSLSATLPLEAPTYVERQADKDLWEALSKREYCSVINARQMGKSSLSVKTMKHLQKQGEACAFIDLNNFGTKALTEVQWYRGFIEQIVEDLELQDKFNFNQWWGNPDLSYIQRLSNFFEHYLLKFITEKITIFIDETDSIVDLQFSLDDFFDLLRSLYDKRAINPEYKRLSFVLIGGASPSTLIRDKSRVYFNGKAINLTGFQIEECTPLMQGFIGKVDDPKKVVSAILHWTSGQPFLTQKICKLALESLEQSSEQSSSQSFLDDIDQWIADIVKTKIIFDREQLDKSQPLETVSHRVLENEDFVGEWLVQYQRILEKGSIKADGSTEQQDFIFTGLVVRQGDQIKVYNRIYETIFNDSWVKEEIAKIKPDFYIEKFQRWLDSNRKDSKQLLTTTELRNIKTQPAKIWSRDDFDFMEESYQFRFQKKQKDFLRFRKFTTILATGALVSFCLAGVGWSVLEGQLREIQTLRARTKEIRKTLNDLRVDFEQLSEKRDSLEEANKSLLLEKQDLIRGLSQARESASTLQRSLTSLKSLVNRSTQQRFSALERLKQVESLTRSKDQLLIRKQRDINDIRDFAIAESFRFDDEFKEALAIYDEIIKRNPMNTFALSSRGDTYRQLRLYDKALNDLNQVLQIDPSDSFSLQSRALAYTNLGHFQKALADYDSCISTNPNQTHRTRRLRGVTYTSMGFYQEALNDFNAVIQIDPNDMESIHRRGVVYRALAQYQEALEDLQSINSGDRNDWLFYNRAISYYMLGQVDEAEKDIQKAISMSASHRDEMLQNPMNWFNQGLYYLFKGKPDTAIDMYRKALTLSVPEEVLQGSIRDLSELGAVFPDNQKIQEILRKLERGDPL